MSDTDNTVTPDEQTKAELYEQAQKLDIEGRSEMDKAELAKAIKQQEADLGGFDQAADDERRANDTTVDWDKYPNVT